MRAIDQLTELRLLKRNVSFAMVPYLVLDLPISVYGKCLYIWIIRRCGAEKNGICFESVEHMAKRLHIGVGSVVRAKKELVDVGLINITKKAGPQGHGGYSSDVISVIDIELENAFFYNWETINTEFRENYLRKYSKYSYLAIRDQLRSFIADLRRQAEENGEIYGTRFDKGGEAESFGKDQPSPQEP